MKLLAQLPTPTIATRTLPSSAWWPLVCAPSCAPLVVLIACEILLRTAGHLKYALTRGRLHLTVDLAELGQLMTNVPDTLHVRERGSRGEHVDGGLEQLEVAEPVALREDEADRQDHDPDRPRRKPDLALDAERLGPGPRVGDHQRPEHGDDAGGRRDRVAAVGE